MLRSDAERIVRRSLEDSGAEFTEEQINALSMLVLKIANVVVEEALATLKSSGGKYFA